ncbi:MAG TPA: GrpB family protein [Candidatus Acidoferrum sp.]|nr:GrpB family protein [Candidatus Acidoferrum sp.]
MLCMPDSTWYISILMDSERPDQNTHLSEDYLREHTVGELRPLSSRIYVVHYDPEWPWMFERDAERVRKALGDRALIIEHVGSTSVPELPAKPIIDIVLVVAESHDEAVYVAALETAGYRLRIREPGWYEHRLFKGPEDRVNLHVFSLGCPEIERMVRFRNWLRVSKEDRELYARTKRNLAEREWKYTQNYADAKSKVIEDIMSRARRAAAT